MHRQVGQLPDQPLLQRCRLALLQEEQVVRAVQEVMPHFRLLELRAAVVKQMTACLCEQIHCAFFGIVASMARLPVLLHRSLIDFH
mmetsp:Transcript_148708/g.361034  ORF Transcript_148708/g.361034 Transcript_148708/m.361034 type:complete len:86 (-) Transcript_148708:3-260(-)